MDSVQLAAAAGLVLSLLFSFVPGLKGWYEGLEASSKSLVMLVALFLVAGGAFGLSCLPSSPYQFFTCDLKGFWGALEIFIAALVANQATYLVTRKFGVKKY